MSEAPSTLDVLSLGLGTGASAAAVIAALYGAWRLGVRRWNRTLGRRRAQAEILDQIVCTASMRFIDALLGVPLFVTHPYGTTLRTEYIYRLTGAWVTVEPENDAVKAYSITITDPEMFYDIRAKSGGLFDLTLGRDSFAKVTRDDHDGESNWIGAHTAGYVRTYHLGKPTRYGRFWLAFNEVGAGTFPGGVPYASGLYGDGVGSPPDPSTIVVNAFAEHNGTGDGDTKQRTLIGPHIDQLRLAQ
ncbi:ETEC_3214 domain-containing protein [Mycolicibacterium gilvum]|uniref:Uncharacterized protein n=1 Tax=Mycolicibacterium gilvum (strain DSM 45189 / LMG 24558 / Spyr1) TaxID=278137 RepID=E6TE08_MYCSR|nr:ETEC_3214 domain-containing protein [Mycolicibacterium gilvum]ADT99852.1 hypothetical protein Mspyr1_32410 [Mycolicibacterium gilvum Spyr1]